MQKIKLLFLFVLITSISCAQKSPRKEAKGAINKVTVVADYGSPSVKGRTIWGGLVPYGKVWRAGANENTTVSFDKDVMLGGKSVKAGKYGFFIIPNENGEWVAIFSSVNDAWGSSKYSATNDVVRIKVTPTFATSVQESMQFSVGNSSLDFAWDKARLSIPVTSK